MPQTQRKVRLDPPAEDAIVRSPPEQTYSDAGVSARTFELLPAARLSASRGRWLWRGIVAGSLAVGLGLAAIAAQLFGLVPTVMVIGVATLLVAWGNWVLDNTIEI